MNPRESSCELPSCSRDAAEPSRNASRILRFRGADSPTPFSWDGVPAGEYKPAADHHCGVLRSVLVGQTGEHTAFHVRYFEIQPGGHTTREHHQHEHVVVVLRGRGEVSLAEPSSSSREEVHTVSFGDTVYIAPWVIHQLRNPGPEPFGFLCLVDAQRDRPVPIQGCGPARDDCGMSFARDE
jgi:ribulose-bisphosphate carboxylase large chain